MSTAQGAADAVWVFLVERELRQGGDLSLHATESDALNAAAEYIRTRWDTVAPLPLDPVDALLAYEEVVDDERLTIGPLVVQPAR